MIRELEGMDRGRYAGPVGWMDAAGDGEWGIALRCAQVDPARRRLRLFAGCGIVAGSDPDAELAESAGQARAGPRRARRRRAAGVTQLPRRRRPRRRGQRRAALRGAVRSVRILDDAACPRHGRSRRQLAQVAGRAVRPSVRGRRSPAHSAAQVDAVRGAEDPLERRRVLRRALLEQAEDRRRRRC